MIWWWGRWWTNYTFRTCCTISTNRIEVCSGGYLGFDPDDEPVIWTAAEYAAKPGWGARLPSTFRSYGTPGTGAAEESVTADWPSPAGLGHARP